MSYIGNTPAQQEFAAAVDYFSGNGSTVAFTLSRPVASVAQVQVNVNNVQQNPGSAYTVSGNTITFTGAPSSGTNNIYVYYTSPITQVIQPGQGTVSSTSLSQGGPSWDTSGNVTLTGNITLNNGAADGAQITLNSTGYSAWNLDNYNGRFRGYYGSTEYFTVNTSGNMGIGTSSPQSKLHINGASSSPPTSGTTPTGVFEMTTDGAGYSLFGGGYNSGSFATWLQCQNKNDLSDFGPLALQPVGGNLLVGTTSTAVYSLTSGKGVCYRNGASFDIATTSDNCLILNRIATAGTIAEFRYTASVVGSISVNGSSTAFNTSSDYRLKENIQPMQNALATVTQLKPVTYTWKTDGSDGQGFIAHELQEVVPDCVTGEKDAVDADGNPVYQGIDTSFLVATLTAAIQELATALQEQQALITTLTERIAALEAK